MDEFFRPPAQKTVLALGRAASGMIRDDGALYLQRSLTP